MIIRSNSAAVTALKNYKKNNNQVAKNLEKLSSGFRINRAADDAAGLAVSEKMRMQIKGLEKAKLNVQDGISLIQTAEGTMSEVHSILHRLEELAVQSANGIFEGTDRIYIQRETDELLGEVDRISKSTHFNKIKLIDGSLASSSTPGVPPPIPPPETQTINGTKAPGIVTGGTPGTSATGSATGTVSLGGGASTTVTVAVTVDPILGDLFNGKTISWAVTTGRPGFVVTNSGIEYRAPDGGFATGGFSEHFGTATFGNLGIAPPAGASNTTTLNDYVKSKGGGNAFTLTFNGADDFIFIATAGSILPSVTVTGGTNGIPGTTGPATSTLEMGSFVAQVGDLFEIDGKKYEFVDTGAATIAGALAITLASGFAGMVAAANSDPASKGTYTYNGARNRITFEHATGTAIADAVDIQFTRKENAVEPPLPPETIDGGLLLQIGSSSDQTLRLFIGDMSIVGLGLTGVDLSNQDGAIGAIKTIQDASGRVSTERGNLGAMQNRLEHTSANLGTTAENLTAAESTIRDVDMAKSFIEMTKNSILLQASQAMLAQANMLPQNVLKLLQA